MFEGILASVLNRYLSNYIDEVDYNNLKVGLFSGTLELLNVKVKPSAMYQFDLPIDVKCGTIGKLKINIPWTNIMNKPAVAEIEDLFVLLGPFEDKINDPVKIDEMNLAYKKKQLQDAEKIDKTEILVNKEKGYIEKLTDTIINNIQIYIKNVHIRYEDKHSLQGKTITFGIYLKEFRAETVDANGNKNFLNADEKIVYKLGLLTGFNVYWNCSNNQDGFLTTKPDFNPKNDKTWVVHLRDSIETRKIFNTKLENFIEDNLNLENRLTLRRSNQKNEAHLPKITFASSVSAIDFCFQRIQYKTILELVDCYSLLNVHKKYVKFRPKESKKNAPKEFKLWWRYIFTAFAETTLRSYKKERMLQHWHSYKSYLNKYENKLIANIKKKEITPKEAAELELLEKNLTLESIFDLRILCKERVQLKYGIDVDKGNKTSENEDNYLGRPINYVEFRFLLNFPFVSLKLKNAGLEILRIDFADIASKFEIRPVKDNFYFLLNTRGIGVYGIYYDDSMKKNKNELVPIVKSGRESDRKSMGPISTLLASEEAKDVLFMFCFESNPLPKLDKPEIENAEYSVRTKISSLEVYYEKTAITELLRFFKTDLIDFEAVKKISDAWSTAGLIYAVENHKQIHVDAKLSSPYFIIPVKGTCKQEGNSIVFFLGETKIESDVQPKKHNYTPTNIDDLKKNFYDKFELDVKNIQVLLMPKNVDWKHYLNNTSLVEQHNYKYHILYPVSTENTLYLSINPSYKKLPKLEIDAKTSTAIKLNFSDSKILKLAEFAQNFPLPEMPKTSSSSSSSTPTSVAQTSMGPAKKADQEQKKLNETSIDSMAELKKKFKLDSIESQNKIVEPDHEWDGPFNLPKQINGDPIPNYCQIRFEFNIGDFIIDLDLANDRLSDDPSEEEYLELKLKSIKIDFAITKYGVIMRAGLGDLKLIDKIHNSEFEEEDGFKGTQILSSSTNENLDQLIKFYFRQVEPEAPNFATLYSKILTNILFDCRNIHLACHREIIIYFLKYAKGITDNLAFTKAEEASLASLPDADTVSKGRESIKAIPATITNTKVKSIDGICEFNLIAKMNKLAWKMYDTAMSFGDMQINEFETRLELSGPKTDLKVKLKEIIINYDNNMMQNEDKTINCNYKQIISCTAENDSSNFIDFNLIFHDSSKTNPDLVLKKKNSVVCLQTKKDLITLKVGKIKIICLVKFVNELVTFFDPIITSVSTAIPTLTEQVKEQAIEAVKNAYQETQNEDKRIFLNIHVKSPQVVIPKNSTSSGAFLVDLGNLTITNQFLEQYIDGTHIIVDEITLSLDHVEVQRVFYDKSIMSHFVKREQLVNPMNLDAVVKRTLTPNLFTPDLEIYLKLANEVECFISLQSAKLLFAILNENLNEGLTATTDEKPIVIETENSGKLLSETNKRESTNTNEIVTNTSKLAMKLGVELNKIKLKIVEPKPILLNDSSKSTYQDFSLLQISHLEFDFDKYEIGSWNAQFKMKTLKLDDLRPDSNLYVKKMFEPRTKDDYFIKLKYSVDEKTNAMLKFTLDHLKINLCLPYILKLYSMVMEAVGSSENEKKASSTNKDAAIDAALKKLNPLNPTENKRLSIFGQIDEAPILSSTETSSPGLIVEGNIYLPEVILFSDPEKQNSKLLIMNAALELSFKSKDNMTNLHIHLNELCLRLGEFNNQKLGIPFLNPCKANIEMIQTNPKSPAHYRTNIKSLQFSITPTIYEVVMGVINTLNKSGTETVEKEAEIKKLLEDAEPFVVRKIEKDKYLLNGKSQPVIEQDLDEINNTVNKPFDETIANLVTKPQKESVNRLQKVIETLDLKIDDAIIIFCEEVGLDLQPLFTLNFKLGGQVSNWTKNLHMKAKLALEASYYNEGLNSWEPLVENFLIKEDSYRPWLLNIWFAMENGEKLQPPNGNQIATKEFPVQSLDYSTLYVTSENKEPIVDIQENQISSEEATKEDFEFSKATFILIDSNDVLNINLTPSAYKVMLYLAYNVFGSRADKEDFVESHEKPKLKFLNFMGEPCELIMPPKSLLQPQHAVGFDLKENNSLSSDSFSNRSVSNKAHNETFNDELDSKKSLIDSSMHTSSHTQSMRNKNFKFQLNIEGFEKTKLSMKYDGSFLLQLRDLPNKEVNARPGYEPLKYNILYQVRSLYGRTKVIFSSPLKIENNCEIKILILIELNEQLTQRDKEKLTILREIQIPDSSNTETGVRTFGLLFKLLPSKIYHVPLTVAYKYKLYATPDNLLYSPSLIFDIRGFNFRVGETSDIVMQRLTYNEVFDSAEINPEEVKILNHSDFQFLRILRINVKDHKMLLPSMHANYTVALYPSMKISNCLPRNVRIDLDDEVTPYSILIKEGENLNVHLSREKLKQCKVHIVDYLGASWVGTINWEKMINEKTETEKIEMTIVPNAEFALSDKHLTICIGFKQPNEFTIYCPYWLVNKSGQPIKIRSVKTNRTFDIPDDSILLFDFKRVDKDNKVVMNVNDGKWSKPFSLEAAGTTGMVNCKDTRRTYNFLMRITMSNSSRSKLITFAPFLSIVNQLDEDLSIREWHQNDKTTNHDWTLVEPINNDSKPTAIWTNAGIGKEVFFVLKLKNGETKAFPLENPGRFVLTIQNYKKVIQFLKADNLGDQTDEISNVDDERAYQNAILTILISGGSSNPVTIVVRKYQYGDSVAKFVNLCDNLTVSINEKGSGSLKKNSDLSESTLPLESNRSLPLELQPLNSMFFIWPELVNSKRELEWTIGSENKSYDIHLTKSSKEEKLSFKIDMPNISLFNPSNSNASDTEDSLEHSPNKTLLNMNHQKRKSKFGLQASTQTKKQQAEVFVSCVSYIEDNQRVVVFTTDHSWAEIEQRKEASTMEIFLNLKGIQLSLISKSNLEIAVISIKDSNSVWSLAPPGDRRKIFTEKYFSNEYSEWLEKAYSAYLVDNKAVFLNNPSQIEVNFETMVMIKPEKGNLKRSWIPGLLVQYRTSANMTSLKCCINKMQIDNQLPDAYFPICFYQQSKKLKDNIKNCIPFLDFSLFIEQQEVTQIYRCFDCILQEFYFKMDKGFVFTLKDWYDSGNVTNKNDDKSGNFGTERENKEPLNLLIICYEEDETAKNVKYDIKLTKEIMEYVNQSGALKQSAHIRFDNFDISPILFNLSFSVNGKEHVEVNSNGKADFILNFFLESIGATITEFKDVKFQFKMFSMRDTTKTMSEVYDQIFDHYKIQVLNQAYVLILGLDVLGNPFGLVSDFSQGVTDLLYDPLLGVFAKANEENKNKIDLEMRNKINLTINKTVSSAAGSGSLITGSVGRILATCTLDSDYKKKRQYKLSKTSTASLTDTLTIAGKGVVSGLVNGVIGVVKNPINERKNGPAGVLKGMGTGFLGLFAKPLGSVFDGVSMSLEGIKKMSQLGSTDTMNIRLPRHLIEKTAIIPYSNYQAKGYEILRDLQNDDIAIDESYWAHLFFLDQRRLLFITNLNIYTLKKTRTEIFKKWTKVKDQIALNKINQIHVRVKASTNESNNSNSKNQRPSKNKADKIINSNEKEIYELYVSKSEEADYDLDKDETKKLLFEGDYETAQWLKEKINSAIKYYKELKNVME